MDLQDYKSPNLHFDVLVEMNLPEKKQLSFVCRGNDIPKLAVSEFTHQNSSRNKKPEK